MAMTRADSAFVLKAGDRVAVIAGEGRLPLDVAEQVERLGSAPFIVKAGEAGKMDAGLDRFEHAPLAVEQIAELVPLLKGRRITHTVLSGAITRRPAWSAFRPSLRLLALVPTLLRGLARGDDGLLRVLVRHIEENGIKVVGAHELAPDLLMPAVTLTRAEPTARDQRDLQAAMIAARAIGALDVGQAAVSIGGRVIALEGIEGTDGLLERVATLRNHGRLAGASGGVLVKAAKPEQELRADLPTIGPDTVIRAHAAGLAGIGVEAERSLVLDRAQVVAEANRLGLFVVGLS